MKVAFVLERLGNGGAERVTTALATEFASKYGYEVHVFTFVKEKEEYKLPNNVRRHVMKNEYNRIEAIINKCIYLTKEIRMVKPDIVYSLATPKTTIMLCLLSMYRNFTLIVSERNDPNQYPQSNLLKKMRNLAYEIADGVVFQTEEAKKYFNIKIQENGCVIPNPIPANLLPPYKGIRKKKIVNFCRLEPQKNLKLLIDAMVRIHKNFPDYILDIYGEGIQKKELKDYCKNNNADNYINFKGFESRIHKKIIDAALYVSSSNYEGISNSMLEALALGVPTISTNCPIGGAKMIIEDHVNGILIPVGDVECLCQAIREVLENENLSRRISVNGIKVREEFSIENIAKKWIDFAKEKSNSEKYNKKNNCDKKSTTI